MLLLSYFCLFFWLSMGLPFCLESLIGLITIFMIWQLIRRPYKNLIDNLSINSNILICAQSAFGCPSTALNSCNAWSNWLPWTPSEIRDDLVLEIRRRFCRNNHCLVEQRHQREVNRTHTC